MMLQSLTRMVGLVVLIVGATGTAQAQNWKRWSNCDGGNVRWDYYNNPSTHTQEQQIVIDRDSYTYFKLMAAGAINASELNHKGELVYPLLLAGPAAQAITRRDAGYLKYYFEAHSYSSGGPQRVTVSAAWSREKYADPKPFVSFNITCWSAQ
jgi:hypothetical protein